MLESLVMPKRWKVLVIGKSGVEVMKNLFKRILSLLFLLQLKAKAGITVSRSILLRVKVQLNGRNNNVSISNADAVNLTMNIQGANNVVNIIAANDSRTSIANVHIDIVGTECMVAIAEGAKIFNARIVVRGSKCRISIGNKSTLGSGMLVCMGSSNYLKIGSQCMLADNIDIWATDSHPIYNMDTREQINISKSIIIGDHVWLGKNVTILKGVNIGDNAIVGMDSTVTKDVGTCCLVAGYPAKVLKERVSWERKFTEI